MTIDGIINEEYLICSCINKQQAISCYWTMTIFFSYWQTYIYPFSYFLTWMMASFKKNTSVWLISQWAVVSSWTSFVSHLSDYNPMCSHNNISLKCGVFVQCAHRLSEKKWDDMKRKKCEEVLWNSDTATQHSRGIINQTAVNSQNGVCLWFTL